MFDIMRASATVEPARSIELGRASPRPVEIVEKGGAVSNVDDPATHGVLEFERNPLHEIG
jgi:hypothetical protein